MELEDGVPRLSPDEKENWFILLTVCGVFFVHLATLFLEQCRRHALQLAVSRNNQSIKTKLHKQMKLGRSAALLRVDFLYLVHGLSFVGVVLRCAYLFLDPDDHEGENVGVGHIGEVVLLRLPQVILFLAIMLVFLSWKRLVSAATTLRKIRSTVMVGRYKWIVAVYTFLLLGAFAASICGAAGVVPDTMHVVTQASFGTFCVGFLGQAMYYGWRLRWSLAKGMRRFGTTRRLLNSLSLRKLRPFRGSKTAGRTPRPRSAPQTPQKAKRSTVAHSGRASASPVTLAHAARRATLRSKSDRLRSAMCRAVSCWLAAGVTFGVSFAVSVIQQDASTKPLDLSKSEAYMGYFVTLRVAEWLSFAGILGATWSGNRSVGGGRCCKGVDAMCGFLLWPAYCWHLVREARATRARRELRENLTSVSVATSGQRARGGTANGRGGRGRWESEMKQASRPASAAYSKPAQRGSHYISSNPAAVVINGSPKLEVSQRPSVVTPAGVAPPTLPASAGLHHARTASVVRALPPLTSPEQGSDGAAARGAHSSWGTLRGAVSTTAAWKMYREGAQMRPQRASAVLPRGFAAGLEGGGRQSRSASLVPGSRNESQRSLLSGGGAGTAHAPSNTASATAAAAPAPWPPTHEGLPSRDEYLFTDRGNRCASNDRRGVG